MGLVRVAGAGWVNEDLLRPFELCTTADVDGVTWYVVRTYRSEIASWLREQPRWQHYEHGGDQYRHGHIFEMDEKLYTLLCLRWS